MPTPAEIYAKQQVQKGKTKGNMGLTGGVTNYGAARPIPKTADIVAKPRSSNLEKFTEYGKNVGSSVGSVLKGIPNTIKKGGELFYSGVEPFLKPVAQALTGSLNRDLDRLAVQREGIDRQVQLANQMYGSGKMSKSNYKKAVAEAAKGYELISRESENIASQADRGDVVKGAANTLAIILSAGRYAPTTTTLRASARLATKPTMLGNNFTSQVLTGRAGPALFRLEEAAARIPSVKALLVRNGAFFSSTSRGVANQSIRDAAMGALIKYPFIYHYTIDDVEDIYKNINDGNPKGALGKIAWVTTLAFRGGILGAAGDVAKYGTSKVKLSAVGRESLLDNLSSRLGDKNARAWQNWLEEARDETDKAKRLKQLRIMQEMNLQRWGNANDAVDAIAYHVTSNGAVDPSTITFAQFMEREGKYLDAYEEITNLAKAGKILDADGSPIAAGKIALGTFDRQAREQLIETISKMDYQKRLQYLSQLKEQNVFWAQNEIMFTKVFNAVAGTDDLSKVGKALRAIDTQAALQGIPKNIAKKLAKDGYVVITPKNNLSKFVEEQNTRKLITSFVENGDEVFDTSIMPQPIMSGLYGNLRRAGLSPEAANDIAYRKLSETVSANLGDLGVAKNFVDLNMPAYDRSNMERAGRMILSKLQQYAEAKRPNALLSIGGRTSRTNAITDIRQLTLNEIQDALKVGKSDAKAVSRAVIEGYTQLPLELRGLGDRAVDKLFKYVPGFKGYNRLQSALRYTYNPFFRLQEITETKILSKMKSGNLLWGKRRADLDEVAQKLDNAGMFNTGFSGEGARDDVVLGRITANLTQYQKRDLAGLATKLSEVRGTNIDDMITNHMDELEDALKVVVQYPSRGIISSPLARTLNLAFFPMRYNLKVTGLVAQTLAKQPPTIQFAVINSTLDASKWLKTDEGLAWQSENSEAIGLLRWITPYGSLESVLNMLNGNVDSISDLGQLGGLPAGFIFQLFESQGTFENLPGGLKYSTPYVNPKTGEVYADKIPQTLKAKTAIAFSDFLNSVFTYPGRTLGLPGKGEAIRSVVSGIVPTKFDEYERIIRDDQLTELQRRQSELLKSKRLEDMTDDEILELYESPTGVGFAIPDLPLLIGTPTDFKKPLLNRTGLPSKSDNSRSGPKPKKVAQPVPPR